MARATVPTSLARRWNDVLGGWDAARTTHGVTDATVWRLSRADGRPRYLKVATAATDAAALRLEAAKLAWLGARQAPVPPLLGLFDEDGVVAVLTEALPGCPAADAPEAPDALASLLGRGLKRLHTTPLDGWPFENADAARLARANAQLKAGTVRTSEFAAEHRHLDPKALFATLSAKPAAEIALVHGDADLANALVTPDGDIGFVDCGDAGPADPYLDLYEMAESIAARLGAAYVPAFFTAYGIDVSHPARLAYYARLDEFF